MSQTFSYWEQESFFKADIIVIGSGLVGLSSAISIKKSSPNLKVIVLERGLLPSGASTKNAGFACFGSISELLEQEKSLGPDCLHKLIEKRWTGLQKLRNLIGDKHLGFENFGGFELFKKNENNSAQLCVQKISHYNTLIKDIIGQSETFSLAENLIPKFGFNNIDCLIANQAESQIHSGKMMKSLIAIASSLGVSILNQCEVVAINHSANLVEFTTNQGMFSAKRLVFTTNAFIGKIYPKLDVIPGRGQVLVTSPIKNLKVKGTFHYDKGYYYFRNIDDRILIGGGRNIDFKAEETTDFANTEVITETLKGLLKDVIISNSYFSIDYQWSGIMAFGKELTPIIEELEPNVFYAGRCNGMGVAIGTQIGEEAADLVLKSL